jgi:hypothetical protein
MKFFSLKAAILLGAGLFCLMAGAEEQSLPGAVMQKLQQLMSSKGQGTKGLSPAAAIEGEYSLASSTTSPSGTWFFTKGRLSVKKIDERHLLFRFACEWKREPKAACDEWWTVQQRDGSLYVQDVNTDTMSMFFDPSTRTFTMTRQGMDAASTLRTDVFRPDDQAPTDRALIRRMKAAQSSFDGTESSKAFGRHGTWTYSRARIQFSK